MTTLGNALMLTLADPVALHPRESVTVAVRPTAPEAPAVKVIDVVPAPVVIVPFVIDQEYAAPAPALGTDAVFPDEPAQTAAGAVIVAEGVGVTVTTALPDDVPGQVASETAVTV